MTKLQSKIIDYLTIRGFTQRHDFEKDTDPYTFLWNPSKCHKARIYKSGLIYLDGQQITWDELRVRVRDF